LSPRPQPIARETSYDFVRPIVALHSPDDGPPLWRQANRHVPLGAVIVDSFQALRAVAERTLLIMIALLGTKVAYTSVNTKACIACVR
jgi:hypothetical protein